MALSTAPRGRNARPTLSICCCANDQRAVQPLRRKGSEGRGKIVDSSCKQLTLNAYPTQGC
eukprot:scaffold480152_cov17-Prasinocladus_malaysianus.AAC.1